MPARTITVGLVVATLLASVGASVARPQAVGAAKPVPVLMYHVLGVAPPDAAYPELYVAPRDFRAQLRWLDRHGYTAVTLRQVWDSWHGRRALPAKPVVITIDDGFRNTATVALPALREHGWPGVLNLSLHHLGVGWGLSERQVRALVRAGWEIDSHTLTHPDLTGVNDRQLRREVAGSKRALERRFRVPVDFFCYPAGRYDARVVASVRRAGYLGATTTVEGLARADEPYTLRRVRINGSDGVPGLAAKLAP